MIDERNNKFEKYFKQNFVKSAQLLRGQDFQNVLRCYQLLQENIFNITFHQLDFIAFISMPKKSGIVTTVTDYQILAQQKLSSDSYSYFVSGSDDEITLKNNIKGFRDIYLTPRVLVDMTTISMKTKILGEDVDIPFGIAPFAMQKILHPLGQKLTAAEAFRRKTAYGLSMLTTTKTNDIIAVNPTGFKIMQFYFMKDAEYTQKLIRLAERQGFKALAITVDTQVFGKRREDERNLFSPPVVLQLFKEVGFDFSMRNMQDQSKSFVHQIKGNLSWQDIRWMRKVTKLKIILKGVTSPEDVAMAQDCGVDAIWISNHGGRQLDTAPPTILVLQPIRRRMDQIKSKMELYIDGGVKTGSDVFKCLALGADFVFLGRGFLFSVAFGEQGVKNAFDLLTNELRTTMMLCGAQSIQKISKDFVLKYPQAKL